MSELHDGVYARLLAHYGPQSWPAESPLEVMVGAVLTQNTAWRNVEQAIANLKDAGALRVEALDKLNDEALAELIRPAGYHRLKARRLKNLARCVVQQHDGSLEALFQFDVESLREQLLSLNGIGPETADLIVLYAARKPTFVVDAHAARVFKRHGWIEFEADYHAIKDFFESGLEQDLALFQEYHALIARVGNEHCRKRPQCEGCPLRDLLPEGGPLEPDTF